MCQTKGGTCSKLKKDFRRIDEAQRFAGDFSDCRLAFLLRHRQLSCFFQLHKSFHRVFQLRVTLIGNDDHVRH